MRLSFLTALCLVIPVAPVRAETHDTVLAEARAALKQYYSSIRSISVTLETTFTPRDNNADAPVPPGPFSSLQPPRHRSYTEWCMDGSRKLITHYIIPHDDPSARRTLQFHSQCNGRAYSVNFWPEPGFRPSDILIHEGQSIPPDTLPSETAYRLPGFCIGIHGESLVELIQRDTATVERCEPVHGHDCWRVNLGSARPNRSGAREHTILVWLDPSAGFLIRQIEMTPSRIAALRDDPAALNKIRLAAGEVGYRFSVATFQQVADPILGTRWFPETLHAPEGALARLRFVNVLVNRAVARDRFVPQPEFGTRIITMRRNGTRHTVYEGDSRGRDEHQRLLRKYNTLPKQPESARKWPVLAKSDDFINTRTDASWSPWNWLFLISGISGIAGTVIWFRRRRAETLH